MTDTGKSTSGITAERDVDRISESTGSLTSRVKAEARRLGFELVGVTDVRSSAHAEFYREWLERGRHGEMSYLEREDAVAKRLKPGEEWPELRSAIVLGMVYGQADEPSTCSCTTGSADQPSTSTSTCTCTSSRGIIARYARGRDYHRVMKAKVMALLRFVEAETGGELPAARAYVDTGPVLERELAQRAGLGWYGRNTMLINPGLGSYFFLAALLVEVELEPDPPFTADRCGTCTRCVEACPTGALLGRDENGAPVMDATRCISYLTIEQRGPIPRELRPLIGNRIYGCDICQEVCPFSIKFSPPSEEPSFASRGPDEPPFGVESERGDASVSHPGTVSPSLVELMEMVLDDASWQAFSRGSPLRRAGRAGFGRNVAVALGNWGSEEGIPVLSRAMSDPSPLIRAHSAWALGRILSGTARAALRAARASESDASVQSEIEQALSACSSSAI